ncbi:hypothetical protein HPB51_021807 [Rhipicephalus microplus]|uniref:Uncharacterized protein n=1 Tax=Rhipicephalus microplus TaxID=6941 RepID=A0A9J6DIN9_RHIMP|nr:hypothetical protein HPB51_021807 [Rhipicephalus microplus]
MACLLALESEADAAKAAKERIKQQMLFSNSLLCALELSEKACDRSIWAFRRNERWFEGTVPHLGEQNFKQSFRVYPSTFRFIVESLRSELERQCTNMREAITPEKRVGIALYKLCSSAEDRTVANLFGVGRSTVNTLYRQFCEAVVAVLEHEWIKMVTPEEMARHIVTAAVASWLSVRFGCGRSWVQNPRCRRSPTGFPNGHRRPPARHSAFSGVKRLGKAAYAIQTPSKLVSNH